MAMTSLPRPGPTQRPQRRTPLGRGGRFRTAPAQSQLIYGSSREHPCKPPPYRSVHDPFKTASGVQNSGPWDPWQASDYPWCTSRGCRVQSSGPWDPWLPVVKNSRLFAQRAVRPHNPQSACPSPVQPSPSRMIKVENVCG